MIVDMCVHPAVAMETPEALKERVRVLYHATYGKTLRFTEEEILTELDAAGVDIGVLRAQISTVGNRVSNESIARLVKKYPDRLVGLAGLDPTRGKPSVGEFERLVEQGFKGLILGPSFLHFYPNDEKCFPVYAKAVELDVPVVFPSYWTSPTTTLKYGHPSVYDDVAVAFRQLNIVVDALGGGLFEQAFVLACKNPNVYLTTSFCPALYPAGLFEKHLKTLKASWVSLDRLLFAGEYPLVSALKTRCIIEQAGLSLDDKRRVLGENAARLLKLR